MKFEAVAQSVSESAVGRLARPRQLGPERHDAGRVQGPDRIIAALDLIEAERVAKRGNRDQAGEISA